MIIHPSADGSEGYQYEVGDRVIVKRTISGGWFNIGPTGAEECRVAKIDSKASWLIAQIDVRYSENWGYASCFPWMLSPHPDTLAAAQAALFAQQARNREQAAFERWIETKAPHGDADSVHEQWQASSEKSDFENAESERAGNTIIPAMVVEQASQGAAAVNL